MKLVEIRASDFIAMAAGFAIGAHIAQWTQLTPDYAAAITSSKHYAYAVLGVYIYLRLK